MKPFDVLVAGEINPDLILSGNISPVFGQVEQLVDSADLVIGSSSVIFACGAARLGLKTAFIGKCGDDLFGRFMLEAMRQHDVDIGSVIRVPGGSTGLSVILNRGSDRMILTYPGLIPSLSADEISVDLLRQARHLHVASYFLQEALRPGLPRLFERAHSLGLTTSLDSNFDPSEGWSGVLDLLPLTNVFLPNQTEACSITGESDVERAAEMLSQKVETVAVKLGSEGALGISSRARPGTSKEKARASSLRVQVVDTVGAGDSFDAGFLYGYLNCWPLEKSLRMGCVCGALSTQGAGGTAAQPTLNQALAYLALES